MSIQSDVGGPAPLMGLDRTTRLDRTCIQQELLGERGLARVGVRDDRERSSTFGFGHHLGRHDVSRYRRRSSPFRYEVRPPARRTSRRGALQSARVGLARSMRIGQGGGMVEIVDVERARTEVASARRIVVFTGAGVSTDSGIPDFRGPNGLWTKNPAAEKAATLQHYLADAEIRRIAWQNRLTTPAWTAEPNRGHQAIVCRGGTGSAAHAVITQNIDGLHQEEPATTRKR